MKTTFSKKPDGLPPTPEGVSEEEHVFANARFYTCKDPERLVLSHPEEAIDEWLDDLQYENNPLEVLLENEGLTIFGYSPVPPTEEQKKAWATTAAEGIYLSYQENFGDPEGDLIVSDPLEAGILKLINDYVKAVKVCACEEIAAQHWSVEEVLAYARRDNRDLFGPAEE